MSLRLLLAEDERSLREILLEGLRQDGFDVVMARDGVEALELFRTRGPFDVLLLDEEMPRLTGREVLRRVREGGSRVAALLISGSLELSAAERERLGVGPVLKKPLSLVELSRAVRQAIDAALS